MLTLQQAFDKMALGMLSQGRHSLLHDGSGYRGTNGCKCPVGYLILDEHYDPAIEGFVVDSSSVRDALYKSGVNISSERMYSLVARFQDLHDSGVVRTWPCYEFYNYGTGDWPNRIMDLAKLLDLDPAVVLPFLEPSPFC